MEITIKIKENTNIEKILKLLEELSIIEINKKEEVTHSLTEFKSIFGLWQKRDVSAKDLRHDAWRI